MSADASKPVADAAEREPVLKCVVWDLDHTLWDGILLEDPEVRLRRGVREVVSELDRRGVLQSIASRNDERAARARLAETGLEPYFLHPQIHWGAKSESLTAIASALGIGVGSLALVDDDAFERDAVRDALPAVRCYDAREAGELLARPELQLGLVTDEARQRRRRYVEDQERSRDEAGYRGSSREFLAGLGLRLRVADATVSDLARAEELTVRTHQLNTTGVAFRREELEAFLRSERHRLLVVELEDRYGSYGKIGLVLIDLAGDVWTIRLLLLSCRVLSRNIGGALIRCLVDLAAEAGVRLRAEYVANPRNRIMLVTYRFAGFEEIERRGSLSVLESVAARAPAIPDHVRVERPDR